MAKMMYVVLAFILADIATGLLKAFKNGNLNSSVMREGLFHKLAEILCMVLVYFCTALLPEIGITFEVPIIQATGAYIVLMELGSCVENIGAVNPALSEPLSTIFEKLKGDK